MATNHSDAQIASLEKEIEERSAFIEGTSANARDAERDLTPTEMELISTAQKRIEAVEEQLKVLSDARGVQQRARQRAEDLQRAMSEMRHQVDKGKVEYRSAGQWARDMYLATRNDREARDAQLRLETYNRAAAHIKTSDVAGIIPDPIVGELINFIDATRPLVSVIGTQPITSSTWHRPVVTQHTAVALQGSAGAAADEKVELTSQKMIITDLDGSAQTLGGYVNVSRQTIDFGPGLDFVIDDLAAQYAIQTEEMVADELAATTTVAIGYGTAGNETALSVSQAVWEAVGGVFAVTKGRGRLVLAVAPDRLGVFGPLFAPINPQSAQSPGFTAANFNSGVMGSISGVTVVMSAGLDSGQAFVFSTAAIELFEQRVGALQVTEPSVLGTQVAYAGYFDALTINDDAIVPLTAT
jgi:HK97 family phage major capsid protein